MLSSDCCLVDKESVSYVIGAVWVVDVAVVGDDGESGDEPIDFEFCDVELVSKMFLTDSIGLKLEIPSEITFCDDSFTSEISLEILLPVWVISLVMVLPVLSIIFSIEPSILSSTESEA